MDKEMKKYLSSNKYVLILIASPWVAMGVFFTIVGCVESNGFSWDNGGCLGGVILFLFSSLCLIPLFRSKKFFTELEKNINLPQITADFNKAYPMRNDTVRFGNTWIFTKGQERILPYRDISMVYLDIEGSHGKESSRKLMYMDNKKRRGVLCALELYGKSDAEMDVMANLIVSKNPTVKCYRP